MQSNLAPVSSGSTVQAEPFSLRADRVAAIAAGHAGAVDADSRFPIEAIAALRTENLLGMMAPHSLGGEGASMSDVADACYRLGRSCSSTGMIFAMHQVKVACVVRHGIGSRWHEDFVTRLTKRQLLLASSTTEGSGGGNVRSSEAPVERSGGRIVLVRNASVISYGAQADAIVTTARRSSSATASDQVLIVFEKSNYSLEQTLGWETLGMRGTCSAGFTLKAMGDEDQVLPVAYEAIHAQSMTPSAHLLWSSVWAGIAAGAVDRARKYLRKAARGGGDLPPGLPHFAKALANLRSLRAIVATALERYERLKDDAKALSAIDFQTSINLLKVDSSELAVETVLNALRSAGLSGYRNDSEVSIGRQLRDVLSAPIMINNDRIMANLSPSTILSDIPSSILD